MARQDGSEQLIRRVVELETLATFQERTISRLDEVVREFSGRVEGLEREVERLRRRLEELEKEEGLGEP